MDLFSLPILPGNDSTVASASSPKSHNSATDHQGVSFEQILIACQDCIGVQPEATASPIDAQGHVSGDASLVDLDSEAKGTSQELAIAAAPNLDTDLSLRVLVSRHQAIVTEPVAETAVASSIVSAIDSETLSTPNVQAIGLSSEATEPSAIASHQILPQSNSPHSSSSELNEISELDGEITQIPAPNDEPLVYAYATESSAAVDQLETSDHLLVGIDLTENAPGLSQNTAASSPKTAVTEPPVQVQDTTPQPRQHATLTTEVVTSDHQTSGGLLPESPASDILSTAPDVQSLATDSSANGSENLVDASSAQAVVRSNNQPVGGAVLDVQPVSTAPKSADSPNDQPANALNSSPSATVQHPDVDQVPDPLLASRKSLGATASVVPEQHPQATKANPAPNPVPPISSDGLNQEPISNAASTDSFLQPAPQTGNAVLSQQALETPRGTHPTGSTNGPSETTQATPDDHPGSNEVPAATGVDGSLAENSEILKLSKTVGSLQPAPTIKFQTGPDRSTPTVQTDTAQEPDTTTGAAPVLDSELTSKSNPLGSLTDLDQPATAKDTLPFPTIFQQLTGNRLQSSPSVDFSHRDQLMASIRSTESSETTSNQTLNLAATAAEKIASAYSSIQAVPESQAGNLVQQTQTAMVQLAARSMNRQENSVTLELQPAELGALKIQVEQNGDSIVTQIIATESASQNLLNEHRSSLLDALTDLGYEDASVDISHEQAADQDTSFNQQDQHFGSGDRLNDNKLEGVAPRADQSATNGLNIVA